MFTAARRSIHRPREPLLTRSLPVFPLAGGGSGGAGRRQTRAEPVPAHHPGRQAPHRHAKVKTEENLDGKYLPHCSDPRLPAEDIAVGYKQLLEVDLRLVYHRLEERIRAHVLLCWLALLLIRITESPPAPPGSTPAASWTGSTSAPSPDLPTRSSRSPHPAPRKRTCSPSSASPSQADHRSPARSPLTGTNTTA
jgi:hypothetical protein